LPDQWAVAREKKAVFEERVLGKRESSERPSAKERTKDHTNHLYRRIKGGERKKGYKGERKGKSPSISGEKEKYADPPRALKAQMTLMT